MSQTDSSDFPRVWQLTGDGTARQLDHDSLTQWQADQGHLWIELDANSEADRGWLATDEGIGRVRAERFLRGSAWPQIWTPDSESVALHMRVLGSDDPYSAPNSHATLRVWVEPHRVITVASQGLPQIQALKERLEAGSGPITSGALLFLLIEIMASRLADAVLKLRPQVLELELALEQKKALAANQIHRVRRKAIELQRYADPQRALLLRLRSLERSWLASERAQDWHSVAGYYVEGSRELDAIVEHTRLLESGLANLTTEQMNRRIYVLTLVSTLVLPLSLITSLLAVGIGTVNGNIMGLEHPLWFIGLCFTLLLAGGGIFLLLRRWWPIQKDKR